MEDEAIVADSAGHTMIDIEAFRAAEQASARREDDPEEDAAGRQPVSATALSLSS